MLKINLDLVCNEHGTPMIEPKSKIRKPYCPACDGVEWWDGGSMGADLTNAMVDSGLTITHVDRHGFTARGTIGNLIMFGDALHYHSHDDYLSRQIADAAEVTDWPDTLGIMSFKFNISA
jgi:Zn-finger nucleic acid-binding protein